MAWLSTWAKRVELTIPISRIDSNLTHFAVPIFLGAATGINDKDTTFVFDEVGANSKKIAITKADGTTQIYGEIEQWDSVGEKAVIWVSKSDLVLSSSTATILYLYFDNAQPNNTTYIEDTGLRTEVWDAYTKSAWHLRENGNGTVGEYIDSTSNNHDGQGGAGAPANTPTQVDAKIGKGQDCDGNDYISVPDSADWDLATSNFTISLKVKFDSTAGNQNMVGRPTSGTSYFYFALESGGIRFRDYDSGNIVNMAVAWPGLTTGVWYDVEVVRSGNDFYIYINSSQVATQSTPNSMLNRSTALQIGGHTGITYYLNGVIDEVRWSVGLNRGQAWRDARIDGDNDNLIYFGDEEILTIEVIEDLDVDIRAKIEELSDIVTDIRARYTEEIKDIDTDIRIKEQVFIDLAIDIRAKLEEHFKDVDLDIRVKKEILEDIDIDIRVAEDVFKDINSDIRVRKEIIIDLETDIRTVFREFIDIATDIRVSHRISYNQVVIEELYFEDGRYLSDTNVTIKLKVYGALKMQFKNEVGGTWSALEDYSDTKVWTLAAGDGDKQVYVRFTDIQNILSDGTDVIEAVLNTTTPTAVTIEAYTDGGALTPIPDSTYQTDKTPFFRWQVPIYNVPYNGFSYALDDIPLDIGTIATPDIVRNGMIVSKKNPASDMIFETSTGYYYFKADLKEYTSQEVTLSNGDLVNDRIDIIYVSGTSESLNVAEGIPAPVPLEPEIPEDAIKLATILVPVGITKSEDATLTDSRQLYVELDRYLVESLALGQHTLKVKGICANGLISNISTFNIWIADNSPAIGEIRCYTDFTKLIELANGLYQTADNTPYFEWVAAPTEPGPIRYYYTEDGTEPDIGDSFLITNNYTPGIYLDGITILKIRAYDVTTGYWGETKSFIFIYGTQTFTDDTAVICGNTILKQSLKEIHVKEISWDFSSARICRFFQPIAFDANLPFSEGATVCVVYGSSNITLFTGRILQIERTIDIGAEGINYNCSCPRQDLAEEYAYIVHEDFGETAQITFNDVDLVTAIDTIVSKFPTIVKKIDSYPTGANISDEYIGQTVSNVLDSIYAKTKYGWYMKPNGSLVSVDLTAINSEEAKFGIYGTTVNAISPQYNVMAANLQFDVTNRYNKCIIEGAKKQERVTLRGKCIGISKGGESVVDEGDRSDDLLYKVFELDTKWNVVKIIETFITYARLKRFILIPMGGEVSGGINKFVIIFLETEICSDNKITRMTRKTGNIVMARARGAEEETFNNNPSEATIPNQAKAVFQSSNTITFTQPIIEKDTEIQGSLGPNNTIRFSRAVYNYWPSGVSFNSEQIEVTPGININQQYGVPNYFWRNPPEKRCASLKADVLIETIPLKVEVTVPGTASGVSKTLRVVNTSFRYSEDPEDLVDDTTRMTEYATDLLEKYKDIKVNGSITLDTIDLDWDLDKTVNLINTDQGSWTTLNAKVIGIKYDFDANTTTIEITSEYLK